mmetsp:Transcript_92793/g.198988  ORF Transcript_92793/g.198988 Transcript_92793/m.198988 type:complete len:368 (-) Transcript_92793:61-1164(-)
MGFDFDDLEEEVKDRAEKGELDEFQLKTLQEKAQIPDDYAGGYLWPLRRNRHFPGYDVLPEKLQANLAKDFQGKGIRLRFFVFYGAGDSFPFWAQFMTDAPDWVEVAIYEWPSHGSRDEDELPGTIDGLALDAIEGLRETLQQHAVGGPLEGAPFVFSGHSIGALIMTAVAEKAKTQLGVEPRCLIVMDRAAPQHSFASDFGAKLLAEDSRDFIRIFNPSVYKMWDQADKESADGKRKEKMLIMWQNDIKFQHTGTMPEGFHLFRCPIHVFVAMQNWSMDSEEACNMMDPATLSWHKEHCSILGSAPNSSALFEYKCYEDWQGWTTRECTVHKMDVDHVSLKRDKVFITKLWSIFSEYMAEVQAEEQ